MYLLLWLFTTRIAIYEPLDALTRDKQTHELLPIFRRPIIVSKETTYLTEPRLPDGRGIDYVAALNARRSKGVTFENNAVVPLLRLEPPEFRSDDIGKRFSRMLGGVVEFDRARAFVSFKAINERLAAFKGAEGDQYELATSRPWKAADAPLMASWIERNRNAINLIESAAARPRHFIPAISGSSGSSLWKVRSPTLVGMRDFAELIQVDALMLAGANRFEEAWAKTRVNLKLADIPPDYSPDLGLLMKDSARRKAIITSILVARSGSRDRALLQRMSKQFTESQIASERELSTSGYERRIHVLDMAQMYARDQFFWPVPTIDDFSDAESKVCRVSIGLQFYRLAQRQMLHFLVDPNDLLRLTNKLFDEIASRNGTTFRDKKSDWEKALLKWRPANPISPDETSLGPLTPMRTILEAAFLQGKPVSAIYSTEFVQLFVLDNSIRFLERTRTTAEIAKAEFALQLFRADLGRYPGSLADLLPAYLREIPKDTMMGLPLVYRTLGARYSLYSVGENGIDDGGPDWKQKPNGDDIGVPWY